MKIKYSDFGRCLVCLSNPCNCKKKQDNPTPQPTTVQNDWKKDFEHDFGAFAILGKAGRFYNGAFANEARIREAVEFIEKVEAQAQVQARTEERNKVIEEVESLLTDERVSHPGGNEGEGKRVTRNELRAELRTKLNQLKGTDDAK